MAVDCLMSAMKVLCKAYTTYVVNPLQGAWRTLKLIGTLRGLRGVSPYYRY